uniref:Glycosyltransferase 2-like domain-containing protein n=1 Tax=viral metagenome TaxID=1070528 RepID=A0A6C0AT23_9ZZZZ
MPKNNKNAHNKHAQGRGQGHGQAHGQAKKHELPMVSVCTPTFNRRPFIQNMFQCFRNQDYPKHRIEWIIVDDGTDKIRDLVEASNIPQIRYFEVAEKMTLGAKRNYMHKFARGSIIVYMDDDDYYPPDRVSHAVEVLEKNPSALCAGSSEIYIYFKHISKMIQCGPYGPNHATAGTFAFKSKLLEITRYEEHAAVAEERAFLKDYTIPFVQLDPMKSILVFSHEHNTFDKRKMLENPHPDYLKESPKTVESFIKKPNEKAIRDFFMLEIDKLLENYEPGHPKMKPDVLKQIKEIEEKRDQMIKEEMAKQQANGPIVLQRPGESPIQLTQVQVVELMQQQQQQLGIQQQQLQSFSKRSTELEIMVTNLQKQLIEKTRSLQLLQKELNASKAEVTSLKEQSVSAVKPVESNDKPFFFASKLAPEVIIDVNAV